MTDQSAEPPAADPATSLAERAGVDRAFVVELVDGGVLTPAAEGAFSEGAPRTPFSVQGRSRRLADQVAWAAVRRHSKVSREHGRLAKGRI
jgi:hypothetical protein